MSTNTLLDLKTGQASVDAALANLQASLYQSVHSNFLTGNEKKKEYKEWILVEGFKGTDSNMCCRDHQYEFGKVYEMKEDDVKLCESGFHLCLNLKDVFAHYDVEKGNRFFAVRALVPKEQVDEYGKGATRHPYLFINLGTSGDKLVAKSIEFVRELTTDEILADYTRKIIPADWTEEDKELIRTIGYHGVRDIHRVEELVHYGYSKIFAEYMVKHGKYEPAKVFGSQTDLSMDMKVLMIFKT